MSMIPVYVLGFLILVYYISVYGSYLPSFYTFALNKLATKSKKPSKEYLIIALEDLSDAPVVGQLFYQQLISTFVTNNQWEKVLNYSKLAVESTLNKNSFSIWYYKATAQCLLSHIEECERSARIANSLCPYNHEDFVAQLFNLAKIMKGNNPKIKMYSQNDQITILFDPSQLPKASELQKETVQKNTQNNEAGTKQKDNHAQFSNQVNSQQMVKEISQKEHKKLSQKQINLSQL